MMDILDKHIILNQVMPCVYQMDNNEPGVLMAILGNDHVKKCGVMFMPEIMVMHGVMFIY